MNFAKTGPELFVFGRAGSSQGRKRPIIIDGQNVAVEHGNERFQYREKKFSARGIEICINYFKKRGHEEIVCWLPRYRQKNRDFDNNKSILRKLEKHIKWTTARTLTNGRRYSCYDDRLIVQAQYHI